MQQLMQEAGFRIGPALSLTAETHVKPEMLYDKEGPFRQEWRCGLRYMQLHLSAVVHAIIYTTEMQLFSSSTIPHTVHIQLYICANIYVHISLLSCCICSSWAVLKPEELKRTLSSWRKTLDEGKADDFIKRCEEHRMQIGSSMSIVGYK